MKKTLQIAVVVAALTGLFLLIDVAPAMAEAAPKLSTVINNIRNWIVGLLVALATLLLTIGGLRYLLAAGDPGEIQKAKDTLKYAALGYGVALLAPVLVAVLKGFVGAE